MHLRSEQTSLAFKHPYRTFQWRNGFNHGLYGRSLARIQASLLISAVNARERCGSPEHTVWALGPTLDGRAFICHEKTIS